MWKPGTAKPTTKAKSPKTPKRQPNNNESSMTRGDVPKSNSSSASKKRLTGATLNMRFMKRKKETAEYERKRREAMDDDDVAEGTSSRWGGISPLLMVVVRFLPSLWLQKGSKYSE